MGLLVTDTVLLSTFLFLTMEKEKAPQLSYIYGTVIIIMYATTDFHMTLFILCPTLSLLYLGFSILLYVFRNFGNEQLSYPMFFRSYSMMLFLETLCSNLPLSLWVIDPLSLMSGLRVTESIAPRSVCPGGRIYIHPLERFLPLALIFALRSANHFCEFRGVSGLFF